MKKIAEKVALVALVCITFVFVLMAVLYATNIIPQKEISDNAVAIVVLCVLSVMYVGLSVYLLIIYFSETINVKRILLYYDVDSTVHASHKVVNSIVRGCAKMFPRLKVKRTVFRMDDKMGLVANIDLESLVAEDVSQDLPQFKALIAQSLQDTLKLKFNSINFVVVKLSKKFSPTDAELVESKQIAEAEQETREEELFPNEPLAEDNEPSEEPLDTDLTTQEPDSKQEDIAAGEDKKPIDA